MYLITKVDKDGTKHPSFTLDIQGLATLMGMATPNKCSFIVERIS
jgi:hypothetical protein